MLSRNAVRASGKKEASQEGEEKYGVAILLRGYSCENKTVQIKSSVSAQ